MKNTVLVTIRGEQSDGVQSESQETIQTGRYRYIDGKDVISYEEMVLDEPADPASACRNILKIQPDFITLSKKGPIRTEMEFATGQSFHGFYQTPYGVFDMVVQTKKVAIKKEETQITVFLQYDLELNGDFIAECKLDIVIRDTDG
ncbi:MAG: DUF1934 domain-containing protein [Lachnospiraceae bacterium]|nr:DUF1934 domain-containing protein [Lachnospiraceae bacterium]